PSRDTDLVAIFTLGDFDIQCQGESCLALCERSYKLMELLRYFITFHNKRLLPETIIDDLWPNNDFKDPKSVLRTQVFRLRKWIKEMQFIVNYHYGPWLELIFSNGYYLLTLGDECWLDTDMFEAAIKKADVLAKQNDLQAIDLYQQALALYKGQYMAGTLHNEWLFPFQNRYHRLYLQALFCLLELLNNNKAYKEIIEVYEGAVAIEPYDETLHLYFLQALLALGDVKSVLSHYNYITSLLYKELGVKPSAPLKALYRQLQKTTQDNHETDLILIEKELADEDDMGGALCCDIDYFRFLYQLEKRRSLRADKTTFLGLITIFGSKEFLTSKGNKNVIRQLTPVLQSSLRKGDVFTWWNDNQILVLLTVQQKENLNIIMHRLRRRLQEVISQDKVDIKIRFKPLTEENSFLD
ncbi:MAG: hypothetical protein GX489_08260, partial [Firmicutes bacterium]|nr:hypothetical protein [Bacillota bacterium]